MTEKPDQAVRAVRAAVSRLSDVLEKVDEATVRAPSALPGWSRGHVLIHLANFSQAITRQVTEALAGRLVDLYDGGRPARNAAIEAGAGRPAPELLGAVHTSTAGLLDAWGNVGPTDWSRPIRHRDGTVADTVRNAWREVEVHTVDLDLGPASDQWSAAFCLHLLDFLRPRTPDGVRLVLQADDNRWEHGTGEPWILTGALTDLTAWMAGRTPTGPVRGDLPELKPWP